MTATRVENQLFRFTPASPLDPQRVVDEIGGKRSGAFVVISLRSPRATLLIDAEGRIDTVINNRAVPFEMLSRAAGQRR